MIEHTFQHLPAVGPYREKDLWARGMLRWDDFPDSGGRVALSERLDPEARRVLEQAREALEGRDLATLAALFPSRTHWRLYRTFADEALFFDLEALPDCGEMVPTVIGVFDADGPRVFLRGRDLEDALEAFRRRRLWVSYNGASFDLPILRRLFPALPEPALHLDLRPLCAQLSLGGGLKRIEDTLGLARPPHLRGLDGLSAVNLWRGWETERSVDALRLLVEYNLYDAINLRGVADRAYNRGVDRLALDAPRCVPFDRGDVLYDLSRLLLALPG